jgi:polyisoprenoid-binding protein YceI
MTTAPLEPGTWTIDAAHTLVEFSVRHMTVARVTGRFAAVSRPATLNATFGGVISHRGATRAGFSATTTINRKDFGVSFGALLDTGGAVVSDTVTISLEVELVHA